MKARRSGSKGDGRLTILHTSFVLVDDLTRLFAELAPGVEVRHIVDDSLLDDVIDAGGVTPRIEKRIARYLAAAQDLASDVVLSQCSSVGEAVDEAARALSIPVVRIDARMADLACQSGTRVGIVATLDTTLGPTTRLIERAAKRLNRPIEIETVLVEGAFEALWMGQRPTHDDLVVEAVRALASRVDVIVCAQGSMAASVTRLGELSVPVLTSLRSGAEHALEVLRERRA